MKWKLVFISFFLASCSMSKEGENCFLDFHLGMDKYEYKVLLKKYVKENKFEQRVYQERFMSGDTAHIYKFARRDLKSIVEPIFTADSLSELRLSFGGKRSVLDYSITTSKDYESLVEYFRIEYGKASKDNIDKSTGHMQSVWCDQKKYTIEIIYSPSSEDWNSSIIIFFRPKTHLDIDSTYRDLSPQFLECG